ncbi:MAG: hypothetical protein DID89_2727546595 [Candidatus Nitrotoga sp. CP45]|nr:MAG: hypothetical protein DID89_2727546595 [Candidatus Nitrotoga sp. CP45]
MIDAVLKGSQTRRLHNHDISQQVVDYMIFLHCSLCGNQSDKNRHFPDVNRLLSSNVEFHSLSDLLGEPALDGDGWGR